MQSAKPRAMVIDDSRAIRMILSNTLSQAGFEVCHAANGVEALMLIRQQPPLDLVLVDWNMPEMNGLEFVQRVRADRRFDSVRLMMVTTETDIGQITRALDAGANEYVMKPFTREALEDKLRLVGLLL